MKKLLAALLCAMMLLSFAHAETAGTQGSLSLTINGQAIALDFDPRPEYSQCQNGYVQASFYAYDEANQLYELYVTFPQTAHSGETFMPDNCLTPDRIGTGLMLFISDDAGKDLCSAATQYLTGSYPEGSSYQLKFDTVAPSGSACAYAGSFEATLAEVDSMFRTTGNFNTCSASFEFTMDLGSSAPQADPSPSLQPGATPDPATPGLPESTPDPALPALPEATPEPSAPPQVEYPPQPQEKLVTPPDARRI